MPRGNVEIVRDVYARFARREFPVSAFHDDICWETNPELPDAGVHRGIDAVRAYFNEWVAGWHSVDTRVEQLTERGDRVIALVHGSFQLAPDSRAFESDFGHIWTLRDGKVAYVRATADRTDPELAQ